mmetsp:Transcript_17202/g.35339  ORF Transcript_17202/g.35339 Transcript_17202/m.35339 type:complete len:222 (+) Transcript_17202:176-841(+)
MGQWLAEQKFFQPVPGSVLSHHQPVSLQGDALTFLFVFWFQVVLDAFLEHLGAIVHHDVDPIDETGWKSNHGVGHDQGSAGKGFRQPIVVFPPVPLGDHNDLAPQELFRVFVLDVSRFHPLFVGVRDLHEVVHLLASRPVEGGMVECLDNLGNVPAIKSVVRIVSRFPKTTHVNQSLGIFVGDRDPSGYVLYAHHEGFPEGKGDLQDRSVVIHRNTVPPIW